MAYYTTQAEVVSVVKTKPNLAKEKLAAWLVRAQVRRDVENLKNEKALDPNLVDLKKPRVFNGLPAPRAEPKRTDPTELRVCIIGAGIAGLYTAHVLDEVGIEYDILEANPKRVGGRLYTHRFSKEPHDYYDVGAMRYPNTEVMNTTFRLFNEVGIYDKLIPYYMRGQNQPTRYNDITKILPAPPISNNNPNNDPEKRATNQEKEEDLEKMTDEAFKQRWGESDPFHVSVKNNGPVPNRTVTNPGLLMDNAYDYYREKIKKDPNSGFKYLINHDQFSLRDYLAFVEDQDPETIQWLETLESATGWFGQAFTENVMESLAFDYEEGVKWWCINGGTQLLVKGVQALKDKKGRPIGSKIELGKEVTAVAYQAEAEGEGKMRVKIVGEDKSRCYATVFNTTTLAALQRMDLGGLNLPFAAKTAIRSLHYDTSTKVGIKFKKMWWITDCGIKGGLAKTDMPLRVCVYPSYNIEDKGEGVLLCSYTWGQDSERVASLVDNGPLESEHDLDTFESPAEKPVPKGEEEDDDYEKHQAERLKELMFDNLAKLHSGDGSGRTYEQMYKIIKENYIIHHAYDWSKDPYASSAFALFGPGDFRKLYSTLVRPLADSRFHVVGEAASAHHAWIVGALNSALRGVHLFLERFGLRDLQEKLLVKETMQYTNPDTGKTETVPRFGRCSEVDYETVHLQVALGMLQGKDMLPPDHAAG